MFRRGTQPRMGNGERPPATEPAAGAPEQRAGARREAEAMAVGAMPAGIADWSGVLLGTVAALGLLAALSILGTGFGIESVETEGVDAFGQVTTSAGVWGVITFPAAMLVGAYLGAVTSSMGGPLAGGIFGLVIWALSVLAIALLAGIDAGPLFGLVGKVFSDISLVFGATAGGEGVTVSNDGAWWTIAALGGGLVAAIVGGALGGTTPIERMLQMRP